MLSVWKIKTLNLPDLLTVALWLMLELLFLNLLEDNSQDSGDVVEQVQACGIICLNGGIQYVTST